MVADVIFRGLFKFLLLTMVIGAGACATTPPKTALLPPPDIEPILAAAEERRDVAKAAHGEDAVANPLAIFEARNQCAVEVGCDGGICLVNATNEQCLIRDDGYLNLIKQEVTRLKSETPQDYFVTFDSLSIELDQADGAVLRAMIGELIESKKIFLDKNNKEKWQLDPASRIAGPAWRKGVFATSWNKAEKRHDEGNKTVPTGYRKLVISIADNIKAIDHENNPVKIDQCEKISSSSNAMASCKKGNQEFIVVAHGKKVFINCLQTTEPQAWQKLFLYNTLSVYEGKDIGNLTDGVEPDNNCAKLMERTYKAINEKWNDIAPIATSRNMELGREIEGSA